MAVRLIGKLEEVFPGAVTEKSILEESTIAGLSRAIKLKLESQDSDSEAHRLKQFRSLVQIQN